MPRLQKRPPPGSMRPCTFLSAATCWQTLELFSRIFHYKCAGLTTISEQLVHFTAKMRSFCCLFYDAECYMTSTLRLFRKMINRKEFRSKVSWSNQVIFLAIPCGTEENHERFQDARFSFGDSKRVPFQHKYTAIPRQQPKPYLDGIGSIQLYRNGHRCSELYR